MTFERLRPWSRIIVNPLVDFLEDSSITPNQISFIGLIIAFLAGFSFYTGERGYLAGIILIAISGMLDLLDGELARKRGDASNKGDFLDHVLDRYADIAIIGGLAAGVGQYLVGFVAITGVLMTSYVGTQIQAVGSSRKYAGLLVRADRFVLIVLAVMIHIVIHTTIGPFDVITWVLIIFGIGGHITAIQRFSSAWSEIKN